MAKKFLFENESASENELNIKFNPEYAKSYNKRREREFLKKLKHQDASAVSEEFDSSEDEEDINPKFDKEFFKTLSSLKSKDPKIYDKSTKFFSTLKYGQDKKLFQNKKLKPLMLKDYERKIILETDGKFEDNELEQELMKQSSSPSYVEEQKKIVAEIAEVLKESDEDNDNFGSILKKKIRTKEEEDKDGEEYIKWLSGQKNDVEESTKKSLKPLKKYWNHPELPKSEKFLRDYILNKGYINTVFHEVPTYGVEETNLSDDEKDLERQAEFEQRYNFRFEEMDQEFIKRYPRKIENSVRRSDDSRKRKRNEVKERKLREKTEKLKELEILKEIKQKEIENKINKLKEVTGNEYLTLKEDELESDFDPETHDRRMREIFNEHYYEVDEGEKKPDCPNFEELEIEDWDNFDPNRGDVYEKNNPDLHCKDEEFNMDCDYDTNSKEKLRTELIENTRSRRKRRHRNKFMEMIKEKKPVFDPNDEKTYAEYIEEYYKMDCEDFIGDIPCRFKYVECEPNDFGLSIEEILLARNKELNQWASLKKAVQIRPSHLDKKERRLYQIKAQNEALKRKIFPSLYETPSDEENDQQEGKIILMTHGENDSPVDKSSEKKRRRKKKGANSEANARINKNGHTNAMNIESKQIKCSQEQSQNNDSKLKNGKKIGKLLINDISTEFSGKEYSASLVKTLKTVEENRSDKNLLKKVMCKERHKNKTLNEQQASKKSKIIEKNNLQLKKQTKGNISEQRLRAYGLNPKKFFRNQRFFNNKKNKNFGETNNNNRNNPFS